MLRLVGVLARPSSRTTRWIVGAAAAAGSSALDSRLRWRSFSVFDSRDFECLPPPPPEKLTEALSKLLALCDE
ncbi:hypothetical protein TYRP_011303 [Tyrophagus putrescentiae]|nr:hypothetical protein TYRP_011303 [Tyrophagus putrescentiae]